MNRVLISTQLTRLRGQKTQKEVAEDIGVAQSTYAMYESGQRIPSDEVKIKLATYYKTTVQDIFFAEQSHLK